MSQPADLDDLSAAALKALVLELLCEISALKQVVAEQHAEIARLKGLKGPPSIKRSGMAQASEAKPPSGGGKRRGRGRQRRRVASEARVLRAAAPAGSRFKGYEDFFIQDLVVQPVAIRFRRERWVTPDGRTILAPLPPGVDGHFGSELRRNDCFTWFGTTGSKSRINFLHLLRAGHGDYVINAEALAYMRGRSLAGPVIQLLAGHEDKRFADPAAWQAHLERLGITALAVTPDPVLIATEGALWGSIRAHGLLPDTVIVRDDAGQFQLTRHGLCWVHAERLGHKAQHFHRQPPRGATMGARPDLVVLPGPHLGSFGKACQAFRMVLNGRSVR